jgi:cytochrome P460
MRTRTWPFITSLGFAAGWIAFSAPPQNDLIPPPQPESPSSTPTKPDAASTVFRKYYKWDRMTPKPVAAAGESQKRCSQSPGTGAGPGGAEAYFRLFVSELAKPVLAHPASTPFPEGAMLVKELLAAPKGSEPRTLLAMVKREEGFNPGTGNWEFFVLRVTDVPVVVDSGRIAHCAECHSKVKEHDFVFRNYLGKK